MKIVHAVSDERGRERGGVPGDQTGKEILIQDWYKRSGGWKYYLEPTDPYLANKAVKIAVDVANSIHFGYSKSARKDGYDLLKAADGDVSKVTGYGDFDCSSLVFTAYMLAGCPGLSSLGYTGNLLSRFMATGKFKLHTEPRYLTSGEYAIVGGVYLTPDAHTCMCIENGSKAIIPQPEPDPEPEPEAKTRIRIKNNKKVWIRESPKTGKKLVVAHSGDVLEVFGTDDATGWYKVGNGYITNNERYVENG